MFSTARNREQGAALVVTMVTLTALLGIGAVTILSTQSSLSAAGQSRFSQSALYTAESGASAGMEYLRNNCSSTQLFTALVSAGNASPQKPAGILGNGVLPGGAGNPFADGDSWYE